MGSVSIGTPVRRASGMSLIELIIVITLIAVLVSIAMPNYSKYQQKARRVDAKSTLQEIAAFQERFYVTNHTYTSDLAELGMSSNLTDDGHYVVNVVSADASGFTVSAAPAPGSAQAADDDCQQFTINNLAIRSASPDPGESCWN